MVEKWKIPSVESETLLIMDKFHNFTFLEDLISCDDSMITKILRHIKSINMKLVKKDLLHLDLGWERKKCFQHAYIMAHTIKEKWPFVIIFGDLNFLNPSHVLVHVAYAYNKTWDMDLEIPILDLING